mgnify:CR=1 FL=1
MKRIILTGGGTAGHVTPNIALLLVLRNSDTISNILVLIRESKRNLLTFRYPLSRNLFGKITTLFQRTEFY